MTLPIHNNNIDMIRNETKPITSFKQLSGWQITPYISAIGQLIMDGYTEWPYLYQGSSEEMHEYIQKRYIEVPDSIVWAAFNPNDEDELIGVAMGVPLSKAPSHYLTPFKSGTCLNTPLEQVFYWGELVIKPKYRQKHLANDLCNAAVSQSIKTKNYKAIAFCTIDRQPDFRLNHLKPANYFCTDSWFEKLGFAKYPELTLDGVWCLVGEETISKNPMGYWIKKL
jgi:hypothetical protein